MIFATKEFRLIDALLSHMDAFIKGDQKREKVSIEMQAHGDSWNTKKVFQLDTPNPCGEIADWIRKTKESGCTIYAALPLSVGNRGHCVIPLLYAEIDCSRPRTLAGETVIDARDIAQAFAGMELRPTIIARATASKKAYALWILKEPRLVSYKERRSLNAQLLDRVLPEWRDIEPSTPFLVPVDGCGLEILDGDGPSYDLEDLLPARTRAHGGDVLTIEAVQEELAARGWAVRHNVISNAIDVFGYEQGRKLTYDNMVSRLYSDMGTRYKKCTIEGVLSHLRYIASGNAYNPVLDFIKAQTWDGDDRIEQLFSVLGIEKDELSQILFRKWLWQGVAMLHNDGETQAPFGADGVLVLMGDQGAGKTSFLEALAIRPEWFRAGQHINADDKDTLRRVITTFIAELGEVGSTMKSDVDRLKAFITNSFDEYRLPYGRADTQNYRHTNLCATCNNEQYLIDITGNRRWWTVKIGVSLIPHELLEPDVFDASQIWAQAYHEVMTCGKPINACFRLTPEERDALTARNDTHVDTMLGEEEVIDILESARAKGYPDRPFTLTEWKNRYSALERISTKRVGAILKKHGIEPVAMRVAGQNTRRLFMLPDITLKPVAVKSK